MSQNLCRVSLKYLNSNRDTLRQNVTLLTQLKSHPKQAPAPDIKFPWHWNSPSASAWDTARNTGAITLMPYDDAHAFTLVYTQQSYVNDQATLYINHHHAAFTPLSINRDISALAPAQIDEMIHGCAATISDIDYLEELMQGLESNYANLLNEM